MKKIAMLLVLGIILTACATKPPFPEYPQVSMRKIEAEGSSWYCYTKEDALLSAEWHDLIARFQKEYEK